MASTPHHQLEDLVVKAKQCNSTEELLLFIAAEDGMLVLCQKIIIEEDEKLVQHVKQACLHHQVNSAQLLISIKEIVRSLNVADSDIHPAYGILELEDNATPEEVKKAFRILSKKYHPDHSQNRESTEKFLEIQEAYNTLVEHNTNKTLLSASPWVQNEAPKKQKNIKAKLQFFYGVIVLVFLLIIVSVFLENKNTSRALQQRSLKKQVSVTQQKAGIDDGESFETTNNKPQNNKKILANEKHIKPNEIGQQEEKTSQLHELEYSIPPDPELLATLQQPFPFRIKETQEQKSNDVLPLKSKAKPNIDKEVTSKERQFGEKFEALDNKTEQPEEKMVKTEAVLKLDTMAAPQKPASQQLNKNMMAAQALRQKSVEDNNDGPRQTREKEQSQSDKVTKSGQIKHFLESFISTYTNRDFSQHMSHFFSNAQENGHSINALKENYRNLFAKTDKIEIKIYDYEWTETLEGVRLHGSFVSRYSYRSGGEKKYLGDVTFFLFSAENVELKISKLIYSTR